MKLAATLTEASWELGQAEMLVIITVNSQLQHPNLLLLTFLGGDIFFSGGGTGGFFFSCINNEEILIYLFVVWLFGEAIANHVSKEHRSMKQSPEEVKRLLQAF